MLTVEIRERIIKIQASLPVAARLSTSAVCKKISFTSYYCELNDVIIIIIFFSFWEIDNNRMRRGEKTPAIMDLNVIIINRKF